MGALAGTSIMQRTPDRGCQAITSKDVWTMTPWVAALTREAS